MGMIWYAFSEEEKPKAEPKPEKVEAAVEKAEEKPAKTTPKAKK